MDFVFRFATHILVLVSLAQLQAGVITLGGQDVTRMPIHERARAGLGYVPQSRDIFPSLTVEEHLVCALLRGSTQRALEQTYTLFPRLHERRKNGGRQLSGGEQQVLLVAQALVGNPKILLLDEPLEGLAPRVREELMDAIEQLALTTGVGCLLVEQHVDVVLAFAHQVVVLERGLIVFSGSTDRLRNEALLNRAIGLEKV
jgi:branched-chain amino acid transport system ATP-binding protein